MSAVNATGTNNTIPAFDMDIDYRYMPDGMYIGLASTVFFSSFLSLAGSTSILYFILVSNRRNGNKRRASSSVTMESLDQPQGSSAPLALLHPSGQNATAVGAHTMNPEATAAATTTTIPTNSSRNDNNPNAQDKLGLYHRLMVGLSVMDWIAAADCALQPVLLPRYTHHLLASGNNETCRFVGFWFGSVNSSYMYSTALSLYFYLTIRLGKKEQEAAAILEPYAHIIAVAVIFAFGVLQIALDMIKPNLLFMVCVWQLTTKKPECVMTTPEQQQALGIHCTSDAAEHLVLVIPIIMTFVGVFIGTVATFLVYWTIRRQTLSNRRHSFGGEISAAQLARTRAVGRQAILYFLAYLNSFVVSILATTLPEMSSRKVGDPEDMFGSRIIYATLFTMYLCVPLQGFFNGIIFLRPRVVKWKEAEPTKSWFWCYRKVLSGDPFLTRRQQQQQQQQQHGMAERLSGARALRLSSIFSSQASEQTAGPHYTEPPLLSSYQESSAMRSPSLHNLVTELVADMNSAVTTSKDKGSMNALQPSEAIETPSNEERLNSAAVTCQEDKVSMNAQQPSEAIETASNEERVNSAAATFQEDKSINPQTPEASCENEPNERLNSAAVPLQEKEGMNPPRPETCENEGNKLPGQCSTDPSLPSNILIDPVENKTVDT